MYFTVYKTTNTVNGKFYVGAHQTPNPIDPYLGSGKLLILAVAKYGRPFFKKEVLHIFDNFEEMAAKEREIVTGDFVNDEMTYNLVVGGEGGWWHLHDPEAPRSWDPSPIRTDPAAHRLLWVHRGEDSLRTAAADLPEYLNQGWKRGRPPRDKSGLWGAQPGNRNTAGKVWAYDPNTLKPGLFEPGNTPEGWELGKKPKRERDPDKGHFLYGRVGIHRGDENRFILKETLASFLETGWVLGFNGRGKPGAWVKKDGKTKRVFEEELQQFLNEGWERGRGRLSR